MSDNGTQFTALEFEEFCRLNGIVHTKVAPYHPSSNGLAERAVRVFMRKQTGGSISDQLSRLLLQYRITPHSTTGLSPAELLIGRKLLSRLDLLKPRIDKRVLEKQERQKADHDKNVRDRFFSKGEKVFAKNHGKGDKWLYGEIVKKSGPLSFKVKLDDGRVAHYHQDHLRKRSCKPELPLQEEVSEPAVIPTLPEVIPISNEVDSEAVTDTELTHPPDEVPAVSTTQDIPTSAMIPSGQATAAAPTVSTPVVSRSRKTYPKRGEGNNRIGFINNIDVSFFSFFFFIFKREGIM